MSQVTCSTNCLTLGKLFYAYVFVSVILRPNQWMAYNYDKNLALVTSQRCSEGSWNSLYEGYIYYKNGCPNLSSPSTGRYIYELVSCSSLAHQTPSGSTVILQGCSNKSQNPRQVIIRPQSEDLGCSLRLRRRGPTISKDKNITSQIISKTNKFHC